MMMRWLWERQEKGVEGWRWSTPKRWVPALLRLHWGGLKNILRWAPVIYRDADFNHDPLLAVLEYKLRRMARYHSSYGIRADRDRIACQLSVAARLCQRLRDDDYFRRAGYESAMWPSLSHTQRLLIMDKETQLLHQDSELLGWLLGEYLLDWCD